MPEPLHTVLVVDRPAGPLMFQETVLRRRDRRVVVSNSGSDALIKIRRDLPRLVVFGYDLGDMTGPELCREIRDDEAIKSTSLLFVADRADSEHVDLCMAAGCNDIILHPCRAEELDAKVERLATIPLRQSLRTLTKIELTLSTGDSFRLGHSLNISSSGMLVELDQILPPAAKIRVQFFLRGDNAPLQLPAQVVRADFSRTAPRYGLRFTSLTDGDRHRIDDFVGRKRSREQN